MTIIDKFSFDREFDLYINFLIKYKKYYYMQFISLKRKEGAL